MLFCPTICLFVFIHKLTLMALFVAGAGLYFFFHGLHLLARRRSLARMQVSTVRDALPGTIAVPGIVAGPHTLAAPITGKRCYIYQTTVWQQSGSARKAEWKQVAEETLHLPFLLEDLTGQLLVEPFEAELDLRQDFRQEFGTPFSAPNPEEVPPRVSVFLARHGITLGRPIRIEERTLEPATPVFIAGTIAENPGIRLRPFSPDAAISQPDRSYRAAAARSSPAQQTPEVIRLSGGPVPSSTADMSQQGKIAAALTRAGITKPEAWAAAGVPYPETPLRGDSTGDGSSRDASAQEALSERTSPPAEASSPDSTMSRSDSQPQTDATPKTAARSAPPLVLMKGEGNTTFVISCHSHQELVGSPWKSAAMIFGGVGLAVLGLYALFFERHLR